MQIGAGRVITPDRIKGNAPRTRARGSMRARMRLEAAGGARQPRRGVAAAARMESACGLLALAVAGRWGIGRRLACGALLGGGSSVIDGGRLRLPGQQTDRAPALLSFLRETEYYMNPFSPASDEAQAGHAADALLSRHFYWCLP